MQELMATWEDLEKIIAKMSDAEKKKPVQLCIASKSQSSVTGLKKAKRFSVMEMQPPHEPNFYICNW